MFAKFKLEVQQGRRKERIEVVEFRNINSQKSYFEETNSIQKFRNVFSSQNDVEQNAQKIYQ